MSDDSRPETDLVEEVPSELDALVETWFASHFHNSVISQDTEFFNRLRTAIDDLKSRLADSFPHI